jgi:hypothetical protein
MKHKVGDTVRIIADKSKHRLEIGDTVKIDFVATRSYHVCHPMGMRYISEEDIQALPEPIPEPIPLIDPIESFRTRVIEELGKMTLEKNRIITHEDNYDYGTLSEAIERIKNLK